MDKEYEFQYEKLINLSQRYGECFYFLDRELFVENYFEMLSAFRKYYENTHIAYSYKTNYLPVLCSEINSNGGCAEIVSEMEWELSQKLNVLPKNVYYNGPYKKPQYIEEILMKGGNVNLDSQYEIDIVKSISKKFPNMQFTVGIRVCADIGQEISSRFGFNTENDIIYKAIDEINKLPNVRVSGLHIHLPNRTIDSFRLRMRALSAFLDTIPEYEWDYISLGGGYMGHVDKELSKEFDFAPPTYEDYAKVVAGEMKNFFALSENPPKLIIEPGSALVADTMKLLTRVVDIKNSRNRFIATLTGSTFNMNPSVKNTRRSINVITDDNRSGRYYEELDMAGYTCIESDYLYKGYSGYLQRGDFVIFNNVGSYSIVMKPPFILPDIAVVDVNHNDVCIKSGQSMDNIFGNMGFDF